MCTPGEYRYKHGSESDGTALLLCHCSVNWVYGSGSIGGLGFRGLGFRDPSKAFQLPQQEPIPRPWLTISSLARNEGRDPCTRPLYSPMILIVSIVF